MRRFLIDTDTASDDAVALVMALRNPEIEVEAITVVAGNVPRDQGVQNALYTVERCGAKVPVYAGCAKPLLRPLETAQFVHGNDGMGEIGLPVSGRTPAPGHAVDAIIGTIRCYPGEVTLVTLGPLTNVAIALARDPEIAGMVDRCVIMGGIGLGHGNVVPAAEYNIWVDPEAAKMVFESGLPITMVGWDVSQRYATFDDAAAEELRRISPLGEFCVAIQACLRRFGMEKLGLPGFDLPDPIAMAVAIDPAVATEIKHLYVDVETKGELTRGAVVVDHLGITGNAPNVDVVLKASRDRFLELLYAAVR